MQNEEYDVIVIGGGISGLLSALVLSKHGNRVLILEKDEVVGGNCRSYSVDGFTVDTGPHAITALRGGPLPLLMDQYFDVTPSFRPYGDYFIRTQDANLIRCPTNVRDFLSFDYLPLSDRMKLAATIGSVMLKVGRGSDYSDRSVYDCLPNGLSHETLAFADTFSMFMSGRGMKETSVQRMAAGAGVVKEKDKLTSKEYLSIVQNEVDFEKKSDKKSKKKKSKKKENGDKKSKAEKSESKTSETPSPNNSLSSDDSFFAALKKTLTHKGGFSTQGYPVGGVQAITDCTIKSMPRDVDILTETRVSTILTNDDDEAIGVETKDGEYYADLMIHTGFASNLPQMLELPASYTNQLGGIDHTVSLSIWLGLDELRPEFDYIGSEVQFENLPYWGGSISNYDPALAPKGCQTVGFAFIPQHKNVKSKIGDAYNELFTILPDIEPHVAMRHEQITIPEKAAITVHGEFADIRTPIKNLYVAGTDTDKRSMGVTRAAYSVMELLGKLQEDGKLKRQNDFQGYGFRRDYLPPLKKKSEKKSGK